MGMVRSLEAVGAPLMQPYQQLQAAPAPPPMPVAQTCMRETSRQYNT